MTFDFSYYVNGCLVRPFAEAILACIMLIGMVVAFRNPEFRKQPLSQIIITTSMGLMITTFFLFVSIGPLYHSGIRFLFEKESDAIQVQGEILEIQRLAEYEFPNLESNYGRGGFLITIDGVQGIMIGKGNLTVGDYVIMEYLPQSRYILSIMEVPKE